MTNIKHDLSNAEQWWRDVGQPSYRDTAELLEKEEAKRARCLVERRREAEYQRELKERLA